MRSRQERPGRAGAGQRQSDLPAYGWAFDVADRQPISQVLVVSDNRVVRSIDVDQSRPDVVASLKTHAAASSGFAGQFALPAGATYRIYAVTADGSVTPLPSVPGGDQDHSPLPATITTSDGVVHPVHPMRSEGHVDGALAKPSKVFTLTVPAGTNLSSYEWMELKAPSVWATPDHRDRFDLGHSLPFHRLEHAGTAAAPRSTPGSAAASNGTGTGHRP